MKAKFGNYRSSLRIYREKRKVLQQRFHEHYWKHSHNRFDDWQLILLEQCETHEQLKQKGNFLVTRG